MPAETVSTHVYRGLRRSRPIDAVVAQLAEDQYGVVGRGQLVGAGVSERAVEHRLEVGRLHLVVPGVYAVGHRRISPLGWSMAAVLSSGAKAVLSHRSAAALWGIRESTTGASHVTVPRKSTSSKLVRRHHVALPDDEVTVHEGVPVTTVPRTILDLASTSSIDEVEVAIRQIEFLRLYDQLSLPDLIERYPGRRGVARVQTALIRIEALPNGHVRSPLERKFLPFLRRYRLPRPRLNDWIALGKKRFRSIVTGWALARSSSSTAGKRTGRGPRTAKTALGIAPSASPVTRSCESPGRSSTMNRRRSPRICDGF
jgi:hypothetical protein